jgi:hypothetical protein
VALTLSVAYPTATVSGSAAGAVTVYAARVDEGTGLGAFASAGSRTGDGNVTLSLSNGYHFFVAIEGATLSPIVREQVHDGSLAVATRCRTVIRDTLLLMTGVYGCGPGRVADGQWDDSTEDVDRTNLPDGPCTVLTTARQRPAVDYYGNVMDGVECPTLLYLVDAQDPKDPRNLPDYEAWAQAVTRAFHHQRLAGVPEVRYVTVEPQAVAESGGATPSMRTPLVVRAFTRQTRGLGA